VPSALTTEYNELGLASYGGSLYLAWVGQSSPYHIWYSAFNGTSWTSQATIPGGEAAGYFPTGPALADFGGNLFASWATPVGTNEYSLDYSEFDGISWFGPTNLPFGSDDVHSGPTLAVQGGDLYWAWQPFGSSTPTGIEYADTNGISWSGSSDIPASVGVNAYGPALAAYGGSLFAAWLVNVPATIYYASGP